MNISQKTVLLLLSLLLSTFCPAKPVLAIETSVISSESLEAFFEDFFNVAIAESKIPGAAIVVVQNGDHIFSRGYGYADLEKKIKVSPSETVFFVESVSKSFTATAVMKLADEGYIDLGKDVNAYISAFQLPATFAQPVTVADLLVHTGGFDDTDIGAYAKKEAEVTPLSDYLKNNMPARVMPPGEIVSYSNHGYALAGLVVEEVSGMPFTQYMDQKILVPLEMFSSSFVLTDELENRLASPYLRAGDKFQRGGFLYHNYSPAGALKATVEDMANFIAVHLQGGQFMESRLLSTGALENMHQQQFANHEALPGWTYGFYEKNMNGRRIIMHGGANRLGHMSELLLIPELQIGLFFASNTFNYEVREQLLSEFMDQFYPASAETAVFSGLSLDPDKDGRYAGHYYSTRQARDTVEKITMLLGQLKVEFDDDKLQVIYPQGSIASEENWIKIGPKLFQNTGDGALMAFREDAAGNITHMFIEIEAYEKLPWYTSPNIQAGFIAIMLVVLLSIFFRRQSASSRVIKVSLITARFLAGLNLLFLAGVVLVFLNYQVELAYGMPALAKLLFIVPFGSLVLTAAVIYYCIRVWKERHPPFSYRLHYFFFTISAAGFIIFLNYWNLIGIY